MYWFLGPFGPRILDMTLWEDHALNVIRVNRVFLVLMCFLCTCGKFLAGGFNLIPIRGLCCNLQCGTRPTWKVDQSFSHLLATSYGLDWTYFSCFSGDTQLNLASPRSKKTRRASTNIKLYVETSHCLELGTWHFLNGPMGAWKWWLQFSNDKPLDLGCMFLFQTDIVPWIFRWLEDHLYNLYVLIGSGKKTMFVWNLGLQIACHRVSSNELPCHLGPSVLRPTHIILLMYHDMFQ